MSRRNSQKKEIKTNSIEELFNVININKKTHLTQNDFINFFESRDFPSGMDTFDTTKYFTFTEGNPRKVTKKSFEDGFEKELNRLKEELDLLRERIDLEKTIMAELERGDNGEDSEDEGTLLGANLYISVLKIRKLNMRIPVDVQMSVSIEVGDIELATEPVYYDSGFALWPNERFAM